MEVDRLLFLINQLHKELNELSPALDGVASALTSYSTDPAQEPTFKSRLDKFRERLAVCESDTLVESFRQMMRTIDASARTGRGLKDRVEAVLLRQPFLPTVAAQELTGIRKDVSSYYASLGAAATSLTALSIQPSVVPEGEYELGLLIPAADSDLGSVSEEMRQWNDLLTKLHEAVTGKPGEVRLKATSTGSFDFFVSIDLQGAAAVLLLVGGVYAFLERMKSLRKQKEEASNVGYPEEIVQSMDKFLSERESAEKEEIIETVLNEYPMDDDGRRNELRNFLRLRLDFVVQHIRKGIVVEVSEAPQSDDQRQDSEKITSSLGDALPDALLAPLQSALSKLRKAEKPPEQPKLTDNNKTSSDDTP